MQNWIKIRANLKDDPKLVRIAQGLTIGGRELTPSVRRVIAVGACASIWSTVRVEARRARVDDMSAYVARANLETIDELTGIPGFGSLMAVVGWVKETEEGLIFPEFWRDNDQPTKDSTNAARCKKYRDRRRARDARHDAQTETETKSKKKKATSSPSARAYTDDFETFWTEFPKGRRTKKREAFKSWEKALKLPGVTPDVLITQAREYAESDVGRSEFVQGPAPWLNQGCWDDDPSAWRRGDNGSNGSEKDPIADYFEKLKETEK